MYLACYAHLQTQFTLAIDMIKYTLFLIFILGFTPIVNAQEAKRIDWNLLAKTKFESKFSAEAEAYLWYPKFPQDLLVLEGQRVQLKGYIIPVDLEQGLYVLSAFPFAACFFCGNAGPESVAALKFSGKPRRYNTDEVATFEGMFKLNSTDTDELNYILKDCKEVR